MISLPTNPEELSTLDVERQMDIVLDAFESDWKKGLSPNVLEYSKLVEPRFQKRLLSDLILTERECVNFLGEPSVSSKYSGSETLEGKSSETKDAGVGKSSEVKNDLPSHFDRFAITKLLGRGSHGVVYEAEDVKIRRRVAIKLAYSSHGQSTTRAFASEAANASRIDHPSIVRILEVGEYRNTNYMVSELIEGQCLTEFAAARRLDDVACAQIVADIAAGVDAAHRFGIIHRDLKPSNIMIEFVGNEEGVGDPECITSFSHDSCRVRILDFGVAKMLDRLTRSTIDGDIIGTPHYMSPEQAAGNSANVDQRSDIFSIGVVLFELLCGKLPFDGPESAVVAGIRDLKVPRIRSIRTNIPTSLEHIVHQCLERNPAHRYQSAAALETDLRTWVAGKKPIAASRRQFRQLAKCSASLLLIGTLIVIAVLTNGFGLFEKSNGQPFASLPNVPSVESVDSSILRSSLQSNKQLVSWINDGLPQSLVTWIGAVERDSATMLAELETIRFEQDLNARERWRLGLARFCLSDGSGIESEDFNKLAKELVNNLSPAQEEHWSKLIGRMPGQFVKELESQLAYDLNAQQRAGLFGVLTRKSESSRDTDGLARLLKFAQTDEMSQIVPAVVRCPKDSNPDFLQWLRSEFDGTGPKTPDSLGTDELARWRAKLALIAYGLDQWYQVDRVLSFTADPSSRNYFIFWFNSCAFSIDPLLDRFRDYKDDWRATAVIGCLASIPRHTIAENRQREHIEFLIDAYKNHPSAGVHGLARDLLIHRKRLEAVQSADALNEFREIRDSRNWYVNSFGVQMNIVRGPVDFWLGAPENSQIPGKLDRIEQSFAVAETLVSQKQYAEFDPSMFPDPSDSPALDHTWFDAVKYCDWLNSKAGIEDRSSITSKSETNFPFTQSEFGYRLPSESEWECYFRAGTKTTYCFGEKNSEYAKDLFSSERGDCTAFRPTAQSVLREWTLTMARKSAVVVKGRTAMEQLPPLFRRSILVCNRPGKDTGIRLFRSLL